MSAFLMYNQYNSNYFTRTFSFMTLKISAYKLFISNLHWHRRQSTDIFHVLNNKGINMTNEIYALLSKYGRACHL